MDYDEDWNKKLEEMKKKIPDQFFKVPLICLSETTKEKLKYLDCHFMLPDHHVTWRDYRGLAVLQGYDQMDINVLIDQKRYTSPTFLILDTMKNNNKSLGDLIHCLQQLKRSDILARIKESCNEDLKAYFKVCQIGNKCNYSLETYNQIVPQQEVEADKKSLEKLFTTDIMLTSNTIIDIYDVFISFDSESSDDIKVMWSLSEILEKNSISVAKGSFSFLQGCCLPESFARAIYNRCRKVILLISKSYLKSDNCIMQLNFAKDADKAAWKNKVNPVYIEKDIKKPESILNINGFNYYDEFIRKEYLKYFVASFKH